MHSPYWKTAFAASLILHAVLVGGATTLLSRTRTDLVPVLEGGVTVVDLAPSVANATPAAQLALASPPPVETPPPPAPNPVPPPKPPEPVVRPTPESEPAPPALPDPDVLPEPVEEPAPPPEEAPVQIARVPEERPTPAPAVPPEATRTNSPANRPIPLSEISANGAVQGDTPSGEASAMRQGVTTMDAGEANIRPRYPLGSRMRGEQGTVVLRVAVGAEGSVDAVRVEKSSGFAALDESAESAVRRATFVSRTAARDLRGQVILSVRFQLVD